MKRIHIAIGVKNVEEQVHFYTKLFGEIPECYGHKFTLGTGREVFGAQWRLPYTNFCIFEDECEISSNQFGIDHLGIECAEEYEVDRHRERLKGEQFQHNRWVKDPNGVWWEIFQTDENMVEKSDKE